MIYGLVIESELHLTSVDEATDEDGGAAIELAFGSPQELQAATPAVAADPDDWLRHVVLADGRLYIKLGNIFETVISADGRTVICAPPGDVDRRSFEASLMNYVLSAALTLQGEEPLHSTVVEFDGRAVGLLGRSGAGKSTLAACLIGKGADLFTDDMLRLHFAGGAAMAWRDRTG